MKYNIFQNALYRHLFTMIIACVVLMASFAGLSYLGVLESWGFYVLFLLCPLVYILMMETLGLASLISTEVEAGTIRALLVTPLGITDLFLSKSITGVGLAFSQVTLLMLVTGGLREEPVLILLALLLGSVLVTGIGFLVASISRDMLSVLGWGVLALLVLAIPSLAISTPGLASDWIAIIPSYYLVNTVHQVLNFGASWGDVWPNLVATLLFALLFVTLGIVALRRKYT